MGSTRKIPAAARWAALLCAAALAGCAGLRRAGGPASAVLPAVRLLSPERWPLISDDLPASSLSKAAAGNIAYLESLGDRSFVIGASTVNTGLLIQSMKALIAAREAAPSAEELTERLKQEFDLYQVGGSTDGRAFFSSYYQPVLPASPKRTERFRYPIYRKPKDMVQIDLGAFNPKYKGEILVARIENGTVAPYFDRRDIDVRDALKGRGLEAAWLENQFDRLDLHVQGSGLLKFPGDRLMMAKYAATNALPYKSAGLALLGAGAMTREEINKDTLKQYLAEHPEGEGWILSQNPRYTFFDVAEAPSGGEPAGTIGQPLTAGRSIAVDPKFSPLGTIAFVTFPMAQASADGVPLGKRPTARLVFCQDTGGAILGPGRVDLYIGHGPQAKAESARVWDAGEMYLLIKKFPPRKR